MKNKFNFSRRNPKTKKIENTGFMEFRNVAMKIHARRTYQTL